jgi:hypothetical protein
VRQGAPCGGAAGPDAAPTDLDMDENRMKLLTSLRESFADGKYRIDPDAVARAILSRISVPTAAEPASSVNGSSARTQSDEDRRILH